MDSWGGEKEGNLCCQQLDFLFLASHNITASQVKQKQLMDDIICTWLNVLIKNKKNILSWQS